MPVPQCRRNQNRKRARKKKKAEVFKFCLPLQSSTIPYVFYLFYLVFVFLSGPKAVLNETPNSTAQCINFIFKKVL